MNKPRLRITFVLPGPSSVPVGGFKVVYEYANRLSRRGHRVTVVHPLHRTGDLSRRERFRARYRQARIVMKGRDLASWHPIDPRVKMQLPLDSSPEHLPDADILVATAWQTARDLEHAPLVKGRKHYLIQHYEVWAQGTDSEVRGTWHLPMRKIVIARWLEDIARELGEDDSTTRIPNGLDFDAFGIDEPLHARDPMSVGMLWHSASYKGTGDGVAALEAARARLPRLRCLAFGAEPPPAGLPDFIDYKQQPSPAELRTLYNRCAAFLQPSRSEGWGLPATEAMLCGCALVTTDNGGSRDYALNETTALVAPRESPALLAESLERVMIDHGLRYRIARAGHEYVQQFTWDRAVDDMEALFLTDAESGVARSAASSPRFRRRSKRYGHVEAPAHRP